MNLAYSLRLRHCKVNEAAEFDDFTGSEYRTLKDVCLFHFIRIHFMSLLTGTDSKVVRARSQRRSHILWLVMDE